MKRALFLDRDGTLNIDPGYISDPKLVTLFPDVPTALKKAKDAGFLLIVVSNQSGIARGLIEAENLPKIHERFNEILWKEAKVKIDAFQICPHHPDDACECRKPKTKLLLDAAKQFQIDLKNSFMIGDSRVDIEAGKAAGCKTILVRTGRGSEEEEVIAQTAAHVVDNLPEAVNLILNISNQ